MEESIPRLGTEENRMKKISFSKNPAPVHRRNSTFLSETCFGTEFREFDSIFFQGTEFPAFFYSAERFGMEL
jgi:hypothetical protein